LPFTMTTFCVEVPGRTAWRRLSAVVTLVSMGVSRYLGNSGFVPRPGPAIGAIPPMFVCQVGDLPPADSKRLQPSRSRKYLLGSHFGTLLQSVSTVRHSQRHGDIHAERNQLSQLY